ncbi:CRISPR-associated endonuclease Cas3'' [Mobiluncus curtisii]|uniref:CRISPR-associated endonuclease Cas3-HD n=2 Tax=Mobiluncus curtisii TaxID=2051 RepID=D6ZIM9_MOBCV|nr:CRISPR-associated endonuclease Cas3'' [Mobiluncus curtisii]ADI66578.1 CRISPR-associated endonuclease Cas3-HD [Mobiluncus curtisii ATCC 43063]SQB64101.1 helicase Cas3 [Mobiluncus curtisii]
MNIANRADWWEEMCSPQAKALWAKSGDERAHLSLPQHLIDAACVAQWLWDNWVCDVLKATLARLWCLNESEVRTLYCFYAGTHDVGKATVTFQRQIENRPDAAWLLPPLEQAGLSLDWPRGEGSNVSFPHGTASGLLLRKWLEEQGICKFLRVVLSAVPDAHHGFTSNPMTLRLREDGIKKRETQFDTIAFQLLDGMAEITAIAPVLERLQDSGEVPTAPALQLMTGMVVMADWIASNEDAFPYEPVLPQVERVSRAMDYIQLPAPWRPQDISDDLPELFRKTFAWGTDITLRPVQRAAVEAAMDAPDPTLMIIEAPTGEGKTEAGLAAAHVLGEKFGSLPELVYVAVRDTRSVSLVNAFEEPVACERGSRVQAAVEVLANEETAIEDAYGMKPLAAFVVDPKDYAAKLEDIAHKVTVPELTSLIVEVLASQEVA